MLKIFSPIALIILMFGCNENPTTTPVKTDSNTVKEKTATLSILPDRLQLTGKFRGTTEIDTLIEAYVNPTTGKDLPKIVDSSNWDHQIDSITQNKGVCRIITALCTDGYFLITDKPQQNGLQQLDNLGDLDGKPGEEIGYVVNWADYSAINTYHILTYDAAAKTFRLLFSFPINELNNVLPENLYEGKFIVQAQGNRKIKYKSFDGAKGGIIEKQHQF